MKQLGTVKNHNSAVVPLPREDEQLSIPPALLPFAEPMLLPGEVMEQYHALTRVMVEDVQPSTNIEWLWTLDLVELTWETLRYRRLKNEILIQHRQYAIEALLIKIEINGLPPSAFPAAVEHARLNALDWKTDSRTANEIEAYLRRQGVNETMINAEVHLQAEASFEMFDHLLQSARSRIKSVLREMDIRRDFARRARLAAKLLT